MSRLLRSVLLIAALCALRAHCASAQGSTAASAALLCAATKVPVDIQQLAGVWYVLAESANAYNYPCTAYNLSQVAGGANVTLNVSYNAGGMEAWYWNTTNAMFPASAVAGTGTFIQSQQQLYQVVSTDYSNYTLICGDLFGVFFLKLLSRTLNLNNATNQALAAANAQFGVDNSTLLWVNQTAPFCSRNSAGYINSLNSSIAASSTPAQLCQASKNPINVQAIEGRWYVLIDSAVASNESCTTYDLSTGNGGAELQLNIAAYVVDGEQQSNWTTAQQIFPSNSVVANGTFTNGSQYTYQVFSTDYNNYTMLCGYSLASNSSAISYQLLSRTPQQAIATLEAFVAFIEAFDVEIENITYVNQQSPICQGNPANTITRVQMCEQSRMSVNIQSLLGLWYEVGSSIDSSYRPCATYSLTLSAAGTNVLVNNTWNIGGYADMDWLTTLEAFPMQTVAANGTFYISPEHEYQIVSTDYDNYVVLCGYTRGMYLVQPENLNFKILSRTRFSNMWTSEAVVEFLQNFRLTFASIDWADQSLGFCTPNSTADRTASSLWLIIAVTFAAYMRY